MCYSIERDREKHIALKLYKEGKNPNILATEDYKTYIKSMPQFTQLTSKDLKAMKCQISTKDLVNGHFTKR